MKKIRIIISLIMLSVICQFANAQCVNGNIENGNFTNWQGATNNISSTVLNYNLNTYGLVPGRHTIMTPGFDPVVGAPLSTVIQGNFSIRLGNQSNGAEADMVKYSFVVTNSNKNFSFKYAMVMQNPGHPAPQQPVFSYMIFKGSSWTDWATMGSVINSQTFVADGTSPLFSTTPSGVLWKNWTSECVDLTDYVGQTVSIIFTTRDCSEGGHYGYAYVDALCESPNAHPAFSINPNVCLSNPIIADGTASTLETAHFWSVQESTSAWTAIGPEYSDWFVGAAGVKDLKAFMASKGVQFKCNTYYRVKLGVSTPCNTWDSEVKLIYVRCPVVADIPDAFVCCGTPTTVILGLKKDPNYTYNWTTNAPGLPYVITSGGNQVIITNPNQNATFTLTVTDQYGCSTSQVIKLFVLSNFNVNITAQKENCCRTKFTANVQLIKCGGPELSQEDQAAMLQYINFTWSNGATGPVTYGYENDSTLYTVTASSPCQSKTASAWHSGSLLGSSFPPLMTGNAFTPGSGSFNNTLVIYEVHPNAPLFGQGPAYNANGYRLTIYNRWGQQIRDIIVENKCLVNGEIEWDGKDQSGNVVQDGVYVYKLWLKNCNTGWTQACDITTSTGVPSATGECKDWKWVLFPYPHFKCIETWDETCIFSVTVLN